VSSTNAPSFDVESIDCNYTGTHIFVAGRCGISVVLLPQSCGQLRKLDDGSEHVLARCVNSMLYIEYKQLTVVAKLASGLLGKNH